MLGREEALRELLSNIEGMIDSIEDREVAEPDFAIARELAEQLREEIESLQS